jgi:plasmid stabilization system protein ParE
MGHKRQDLTNRPVKFWRIFSYLVVYDPTSVPLTVIAVLHGARDVEHILKEIDP